MASAPLSLRRTSTFRAYPRASTEAQHGLMTCAMPNALLLVDCLRMSALQAPVEPERRDRVGEPLQLQRSERDEPVFGPVPHERAQDVGDEDLPPAGAIAQALGHHHRPTEIITLGADRLSRVQPDPQS